MSYFFTPKDRAGMAEQADVGSPPGSSYLRRERVIVLLFLVFTMATLAHFVHDHWFSMDPTPYQRHAALPLQPAERAAHEQATVPPAYAPNVYRVGTRWLQGNAARLLPIHWSVTLATFDFAFGLAASWLLYLVTVADLTVSPVERDATVPWARISCIGFFLAALQLPLNWIVPWQRPETMPSAFYLAAALCCCMFAKLRLRWAAALLLLTLLQSLVRSDVPAVLGVAISAVAVCRRTDTRAARRQLLGLGAAVAGTAVAVQAVLQFVIYPHAPYPPGTPMFQLPFNLSAHNLGSFGLATAPAWTLLWVARRSRLSTVDTIAFTAAALDLPVWWLVGSTAEVRIFVPFLMLLCPAAAHILTQRLAGNWKGQGR